jgi:hypothetical protein
MKQQLLKAPPRTQRTQQQAVAGDERRLEAVALDLGCMLAWLRKCKGHLCEVAAQQRQQQWWGLARVCSRTAVPTPEHTQL